jgi:RNA polymerase sigma-70 factor (ECF subfamily)
MVHLYTPLIYYWCRRAELSRDESEDVTQDVFRTVAQSFGGFRREGQRSTFRGWLRTIFKSRVVDFVRGNADRPGGQGGTDALLRLNNIPDDDANGEDANGEADPDVQELFGRVLQLIQAEFSDLAWQAFWLTAVDGRSSQDVADQLGMTAGAVRQAKYRILRRTREEMGDVE